MNSFQELNFYSNIGVPYADDRTYTITFSANTATSANINLVEGNVFSTIPGIDITNVQSTPSDIVYTVNVSALSGANVSWTDPLPEGLVANTGGVGIYRVYGVNGVNVWNQIKAPNISMPRDYAGSWTLTSSITYPNTANVAQSNVITWTNTVTVSNVAELSFSSLPANVTYNQYANTAVSPYPVITDAEADGQFTLVVTANGTSAINNITSAGTGGNVAYDSGARKYTITGFRNQVNSHLSSLTFRPEFAYVSDFQMYYTLKNPDGVNTDQLTQWFNIGNQYPVLTTPGNVTYTQDTATLLTSYPQLPDDSSWATPPTYTITVTPSTTAAVANISTGGAGGTVSFNNTSKVLTLSGTRIQVNSHLATLTVNPAAYYNQSYTLSYLVTSPGGTAVTQYINIGTVAVNLSTPSDIPYDEDVTQYAVDVADPVDTNFGIAAVTLPFTYRITPANASSISSIVSSGNLGATTSTNVSTKAYTVTGNLAQIRSELANVTITPGTDFAEDFDLYYTLTTTSGNVNANVKQTWLIGGTNVETINVTDPRYYNKNRGNYLFPNAIPQVFETVAGDPNYTVKLTLGSNVGVILDATDTLTLGNVTTYSNVTSSVSANVISCINWNGTNGSTPSNIDQVAGPTISYLGTTALSTARSKFGNASLAIPFAGVASGGAVINPPTSTYFDFGVNDFTIDGWVYFTSANNVNGGAFIDFRTAAFQDTRTYSDFFTVSGSNIYFNVWLGSALNGTLPITAGSWHHIAISRKNKTFRTFINGQLDIESFQERDLTAGTFTPTPRIGTKYASGGGDSTPMNVDDLRIVKGVALYDASFAVPTVEATPAGTTRTELTAVSTTDFSAPGWFTSNLTYVVTGTKSAVNAKMANVYMYPQRDTYSNTTVTYTQIRNGSTQTTSAMSLIGSDSEALPTTTYTFSNTAVTHTFTPTISQLLYQNCEVLAVAGGGCGGNSYAKTPVLTRTYGGGGGAGGLFYSNNYRGFGTLGTYQITVGAGGGYDGNSYPIPAKSGNPTLIRFATYDVVNLTGGGYGGVGNPGTNAPYWTSTGGSGGSGGGAGGNQNYNLPGGSGVAGQGFKGGDIYYQVNNILCGGGGATGEGGGFKPGAIPDTYGVAGPGFVSNISGTSIEYAAGGGYTGKTTPGSGGAAGSAYFNTTGPGQYVLPGTGQDGIVIIKFT